METNKLSTKEKGDIGLTQVIATLTKNQIQVALPLAEHLPFDLIAISNESKLSRVSVKYSNNPKKVSINLRTISTNSKGYNVKFVDKNKIDAFAVYSPITNECYFVNKKNIATRNIFSLNFSQMKSRKNVNLAKDFIDPNKLFMEE